MDWDELDAKNDMYIILVNKQIMRKKTSLINSTTRWDQDQAE